MKKNIWIGTVLVLVGGLLFSGSAYNPRIIAGKYFFNRGNSYYSGGKHNLEKAEKFFKYSLSIGSDHSYAHYQLARIYLVRNDLEKAKAEIDQELKYHPENKRSFYVRGLIDGYLKNYAEAQDDFKKFIDYAPNEWAGYMDLSWVYLSDGKFQEAADASGKGLEKYPENVWLLSNYGLAEYKLKNFEEAKKFLERGKELAKNLTVEDWKKAYPGNDPAGAERGVDDIKGAISYNLALAYKNSGDMKKYIQEVDYYSSLYPSGDPRRNKIYDSL